MSSQDEDTRSLDKGSEDKGSENHDDVLMKPKISYSREFLLSISNLDICKKLPSGFDESLMSELEDAPLSFPDRPRIPGSLPFQGFRRNEYASSPPTRGDSGSYSRGIYGKWESRSSARSDRDSDSQSDRDSDSGKRYGHQSRRSWQNSEHDGLLGSGSFPRQSGYASGISADKVRANEHNQLTRSSEPYHPPRPYKALPHSRRDTDSYNDETFGSMECTSEDRAEQERRRRASFEMMRKEQQKALQEKQKAGGVSNLSEVLADSKEEKGLLVRNTEVEVSAVTPIVSNDLEKSSFAPHAPAARPLIPPGFKNNPLEKSSGFKSLIHPPPSEVGKPITDESPVDADSNLIQGSNDDLESQLSQEISLVDGQPTEKTQHALLPNKGENVNIRGSVDVPFSKPGIDDQLLRISSHLDSLGPVDDPVITELNAEVLEDKTVNDSSKNQSSILEKIFGSTLSMNDGHSSSPELHDSKADYAWSPNSVQSSKFAQWFSEEEAKTVDDISSARQNDLLSLIVSGDTGKFQVSDSEVAKHFRHDLSYKTPKQPDPVKPDMPSAADGVSGQVCINNKEEAISTVLTCEDLEQTILSEYSAKTTNMQPDLKSRSATGGDNAQTSAHVDNHASFHLLSMLQRSTDHSNTTVNSLEHDRAAMVNEPEGEENGKVVPSLGKTLTLEALFGTAFMQELQSVEAPVSVQRGSIGSARVDAPEPHGLSFPVSDNDISSPTIGETGLPRASHDYGVSSNHRQHTQLSEAENWHFDDTPIGITSPKRHPEAPNKHGGLERVAEFQLPEEENLISVGDTQDPRMLTFMPTGNSMNNVNPSSSAPINIMEKLAAFGPVVKDKHSMEGSEGMPFARDSYQQMQPDISYHNLQLQQQPSPHFQPPQMSQGRPLYHHVESDPAHMSSQLKFLGPEPIFNHDSPANHQFPSNIVRPSFPHPNVRVSGFDVPSQHPVLHHVQMPGNHHPHFARGGPVPHPGNQATGFVPEMNQMQGFPFGPRQPSIGSGGVPMPVELNRVGNPPEAFQRLLEMELRANSKQIHPFAPVHSQGMYGHEVDMGFRYR